MGSYKVVNRVVNRTIKKNISYHRYLLKWYSRAKNKNFIL